MRFVRHAAIMASALVLSAGAASAQTMGQPGSFPLHEEHGAATLVEISGAGSPYARMTGEFTRADIKEMCERIGWRFYSPSYPFRGVFEDKRTIQICREREETKPLEQRRYVALANCAERLLKIPLGYTFRRSGNRWETETGRPVDTEFSPAFMQIVDKQFDMLCPSSSRLDVAALRP